MTDHTRAILVGICWLLLSLGSFAWWFQLARRIYTDHMWESELRPVLIKRRWGRLWLIYPRWYISGRKVVALFLLMSATNYLDIVFLRFGWLTHGFPIRTDSNSYFVLFGRLSWALAFLWMFQRWIAGDILSHPKAVGGTPQVSPETPD